MIGEAEVSQSHSHSQDHDHSHDHGHTHDHEEEHAHAHTHNREEHSHSPGAAHVHDHSSEHSHGPEDGHGHAHGHADHHHHDHTHDDSVGSVSLELEGFLDLDKVPSCRLFQHSCNCRNGGTIPRLQPVWDTVSTCRVALHQLYSSKIADAELVVWSVQSIICCEATIKVSWTQNAVAGQ